MSTTGLSAFDTTLQKTQEWLKDIMAELKWEDKHRAYQALRAVLHALRDRLTIEETAQLGAQLPLLIRGAYYEGWQPHGKPLRERSQEEFLGHIEDTFGDDISVNARKVSHAVLQVLAKHVSQGEIEDIKHTMPTELRALWP